MKLLFENLQKYLSEAQAPHLNKWDPGRLLARLIWILESRGLDKAADSVREVSKVVSEAWMNKDLPPEEQEVVDETPI